MSHYYRDKSADTYTSTLISPSIVNNIQIKNKNNTEEINSKDENKEEKTKNTNVSKSTLVAAIDNLNLNKSINLKDEGGALFKKKIDKLNLKFYIETEKYLNNQNDMDRCQDQLFIILFKQISLYSEELERLNNIIKDYKNELINKVKKSEEITKFENLTSINNSLRSLNKELEKRIQDRNNEENKLKQEIDSLKRQVKFYKEKLQIDLTKKNNTLTTSGNSGVNLFNSSNIPVQKKNISSDKVISLTDDKNSILKEIKDKEIVCNMYKPTLSMNNFHKKGIKSNQNTDANKVNNKININSTPSQVQISSVTEYFNSSNNNQQSNISISTNNTNGKNDRIENDLSISENLSTVYSSMPQKLTKKRNFSDNDPHSNLLKLGKESNNYKPSERVDLKGSSKIILPTEASSSKHGKENILVHKKPAVSLLN